MLKTGQDYLESLRDGRVLYLGGERITDVTTHPAFRNAARSYARLYDARAEPAYRDALTHEENGERYAAYYLKPRTLADLEQRSRCSAVIADLTCGMMGRSPDFIGGYLTGAVLQPEVYDRGRHRFSPHVLAYFEKCRREDLFLAHAVTPLQGSKDAKFAGREAVETPQLRVVRTGDAGVVISGIKLLATGAAFSHETWIGNIQPLAPGHEAEAITCMVPNNAPGLELWSRKAFERYAVSEFDNPVSYRFDESDCIVVCKEVHVPWERVVTLDDIALSRAIYFETPSHTLSNHQAAVRFRTKLKLFLGLARRIVEVNGTDKVPAVADELGHLAAVYGQMCGMVDGQIHAFEDLGNGYLNYNRHLMYASIYFAYQHYDHFAGKVRELAGGGALQMPADISVLDDAATRATFETLWQGQAASALERFKVHKLAWDVLASEFAARHAQYEKFYMGPAYIVRAHNLREAPWPEVRAYTERLLGSYDAGPLLEPGRRD
jgi:4-hydroxyphenylacetate 3-monooxygenase